jgi:hypothetical protein
MSEISRPDVRRPTNMRQITRSTEEYDAWIFPRHQNILVFPDKNPANQKADNKPALVAPEQ